MKAILSGVTLCTLLAACAGSGPIPPASQATSILSSSAGVYKGALASHQNVTLLALYDGTAWLFYGTPTPGQKAPGGVIVAFAGHQTANGQYTGSDARNYSLESGNASPVAVAIDFSHAPSIQGVIDGSNGNGRAQTAFTATADTMPAQTASLNAIAGLYVGHAGSLAGGTTSRVSVTKDGFLAGTTPGGCVFRGTVKPNSGVNAYDVSISFGPTPCPAADATITGHAILDQGHLTAAFPRPDHSDLFVFDGRR
ncbi:hypothetical protein [Paraburkholderia saeva]|uniref:hypothetical protein n=1 Tax=Paraburkholderia saeva TaxID=2777537 RepID=UPI001DD73A52|nr:hypothetical protein [Paraburkholderia saeva]CAG4893937.1 hypothetical protein R70241_01681 [Paraburkholderia saeva]